MVTHAQIDLHECVHAQFHEHLHSKAKQGNYLKQLLFQTTTRNAAISIANDTVVKCDKGLPHSHRYAHSS